MKRRCLSFIFSLSLISYPSLSKDIVNKLDNQYNRSLEDKLPAIFFEPIQCTRSSISYFLENTYNHPLYGPKYFAFNLLHVTDFIRHASTLQQPRRYIAKSLRLFLRKQYSLLYININSTAFFEFLKELPVLLKPYFDRNKEKQKIVKSIKDILYNFLVHDFTALKTNPNETLQNFAEKVYDSTLGKKEADMSLQELRFVVLQFLETACNKLIWSSLDQEESWHLLKSLSSSCEELYKNHIITAEQLDNLLWILIYRYSYFLELEGAELSSDFYALARKDLSQETVPLWTFKETFPYGGSKVRYLYQALMEGEIRARASNLL